MDINDTTSHSEVIEGDSFKIILREERPGLIVVDIAPHQTPEPNQE